MQLQDVHYALRQIRRSPGFAFTVVFTLALSVGVATAVFCVIDSVILRPLPYAHPERIVSFDTRSGSGYTQPSSWPSYKDARQQSQSFAALAGYNDFYKITMQTPGSGPVQLPSVHASDNFFQVFGVPPFLGRTFLPGEQEDGKNLVAVLSYEVWQQYFGSDQGVVNHSITLDGQAYTVIGVMPAGFRFPLSLHKGIYTPRLVDHDWMQLRGNHWMRTIARLKDGVSVSQAQQEFNHVLANIGKQYPDTDGGRTVTLLPNDQPVDKQTKGTLWALLAAVLAVLAIGCVNVAGLLLARGVRREREMAMRSAIGASRSRIVRQVLTEGVILAVLGAFGGVALASGLLSGMRVFLIKALARGADVHMNWAVLSAAVGVALLASLVASLYPALRMSSVNPNAALKAGGNSGTTTGQHRLRSGFVITQVALTLVLLVVAGLLIRVVTDYRHVEFGFNPDRILTTGINVSPARYQGRDIENEFWNPLLERVQHIPGVRAVGIINVLPIEAWGSNSDVHIAGQPPYAKNRPMLSEVRLVSPGYFDVFGIQLRRGRLLSPLLDHEGVQPPSVVVNEAFVKQFIPGGLSPVGQRFDDNSNPEMRTQIVGVLTNVRQSIKDAPMAEHDYLIDELPIKERNDSLPNMTLIMRFDGGSAGIMAGVRSALHDIDPTVPLQEARSMTEVISETLIFQRMEGWLFGIFATLALGLALVGLYGLLSHEVELSTREIGVRMALGASRSTVLGMQLYKVSWMLGGGIAVGLVLTLLLRRLIGMVIFLDLQKEAPAVLTIALVMVFAGYVAALIPARRAASIDPMQALRND